MLDFVNAGLLFFAVLGASVTLFTGVFAVGTWACAMSDARHLNQLGFAVDSGVAFGFCFGLPAAVALAAMRAAGAGVG